MNEDMDIELIEQKTEELCNILEGMKVPEAMTALGSAIVQFVHSINARVPFIAMACQWLSNVTILLKEEQEEVN